MQVDRVPQDDGGDDQVQRRGARGLALERTVAEPPEPVQADGPGKRVAGLAFVQLQLGGAADLGVLDPSQGPQGTLDAAQLAEGGGEAVLPGVGPEPLEHQRGADGPGADRSREAEQLVPLAADEIGIETLADQRRRDTVGGARLERVEPAVIQPRHPRREPVAQQRA